MKKYSDRKNPSRESIIGLGEDSFRKNYYPELQEKILDLEKINVRNKAIITAIPDVLLISDVSGNISTFGNHLRVKRPIIEHILNSEEVVAKLQYCVEQVVQGIDIYTDTFQLFVEDKLHQYEVRSHLSEINEVLLIIRDMTTRIELEERLRFMAERDSMTEVYNRWSFEKQLKTLDQSQAQNLGLLVVDINGVKFVNDTLGHSYGDKIIKATAHILESIFSEIGIVSRIGGDEFGIIFENLEQKEVFRRIDILEKNVKGFNESHDKLVLSIAYGYAYHEKGLVEMDRMYQEADNNMYQNKLLKSESNRSHVVKSLMKALEVRDYITEGHADRMEAMAIEMGKVYHLSTTQIDKIALLAKFHDIGKVGIPDAILNKPGKLNDEEYTIMKTHAQIGERIAIESGELKEIAPLILRHHEKYDGSGYPLGLSGDDIPIECRILSIVDAYDAMTNDRPYRKAMRKEEAVIELNNNKGTQFDPVIVDCFISKILDT